jgi:aryl-alcohol dehydrogenase-like predicted oxidoreductase
VKKHPIPGTDLRVSAICYGTAPWGTSVVGAHLDNLFSAFRDAGGNFIDTAHCYAMWVPGGDGASERALADYFRRNGGQDEIIVCTKGGHLGARSYRTVDRYMSPERVSADIDDSLGRLERDVIDLYLLHRDDLRMEVSEIIEYLNREVERGRIRYFGASNWTAERLAMANAYAERRGLQGFSISQPHYALAKRGEQADATMHTFDEADHVWHSQSKLPVMSYASTAGGYFATDGQSRAGSYDSPQNRARLQRVRELAGELGCTPSQIALAFLMCQSFLVVPIIGTKNIDHLADALGSVDVVLSPEQMRWVEVGE